MWLVIRSHSAPARLGSLSVQAGGGQGWVLIRPCPVEGGSLLEELQPAVWAQDSSLYVILGGSQQGRHPVHEPRDGHEGTKPWASVGRLEQGRSGQAGAARGTERPAREGHAHQAQTGPRVTPTRPGHSVAGGPRSRARSLSVSAHSTHAPSAIQRGIDRRLFHLKCEVTIYDTGPACDC